MCLEHGGDVRDEISDSVPFFDTCGFKRSGTALNSVGEFSVGVAARTIDDSFFFLIDPAVSLHEVQWRERGKIGGQLGHGLVSSRKSTII
jgi:hypothetical protein